MRSTLNTLVLCQHHCSFFGFKPYGNLKTLRVVLYIFILLRHGYSQWMLGRSASSVKYHSLESLLLDKQPAYNGRSDSNLVQHTEGKLLVTCCPPVSFPVKYKTRHGCLNQGFIPVEKNNVVVANMQWKV